MESIKRPASWLWVSALASIFAVVAFGYAYLTIGRIGGQCVAQAFSPCRDFMPWIWAGCAFLGVFFVGLTIGLLKRQRLSHQQSLSILLLLAVLVAALMWLGSRSGATNVAGTQTNFGNAPKLMAFPSDVNGANKALAVQSGKTHPFPELPETRAGLAMADDPFMATSKEEQAWLDRNGYPNAKKWEAYGQATDALLAQAAAAGDKPAAIMLNHRQLMAGDDSKIEALLTQGAQGSGFALDLLASHLANGDSGGRITAFAISRVSEMRGNLRAAGARDMMFNTLLTPTERLDAEQEAKEIYNSLYELQKETSGPNARPVDPRPIGG